MKNLTAGTVASRESLLLFSNLFGCTAGLRCEAPAVAKPVGSLGQFIDRQKYAHVFIDEGQDIKLDWYPLIREVAANDSESGPSIIVFYDDAQNVYTVKRPGTADAPPWKELLGSVPHPRGLRTIMRVGHRNTNEILTFSYNLLLGAFAEQNPQMAKFAGLAEYEKETIPDDASLDHPRAGKPCVERLDERQYLVNFAISKGPLPVVQVSPTEELMLKAAGQAGFNVLGG